MIFSKKQLSLFPRSTRRLPRALPPPPVSLIVSPFLDWDETRMTPRPGWEPSPEIKICIDDQKGDLLLC